MNEVDRLQNTHDDLLSQIEMEIRRKLDSFSEQEALIRLVNRYGNACIKLVEAEHA